jgi:hypothetical protein
MSEDKKIFINGTNNKYQINKLKKEPITIKKKKDVERWGIPIQFFEEEKQIDILEDLILLLERKSNIINNFKLELTEEHYKIILSLINKKLSSYKQQDIIKKRLDNQNFIQIEEVIDIFKKNQLSCYYCNEKVCLLYEIVRENKQWTLDRINNDIGHNSGNCVLACLSCNLKRRRIGADAFLFTKQLNIVKQDSETKNTNIV